MPISIFVPGAGVPKGHVRKDNLLSVVCATWGVHRMYDARTTTDGGHRDSMKPQLHATGNTRVHNHTTTSRATRRIVRRARCCLMPPHNPFERLLCARCNRDFNQNDDDDPDQGRYT